MTHQRVLAPLRPVRERQDLLARMVDFFDFFCDIKGVSDWHILAPLWPVPQEAKKDLLARQVEILKSQHPPQISQSRLYVDFT